MVSQVYHLVLSIVQHVPYHNIMAGSEPLNDKHQSILHGDVFLFKLGGATSQYPLVQVQIIQVKSSCRVQDPIRLSNFQAQRL